MEQLASKKNLKFYGVSASMLLSFPRWYDTLWQELIKRWDSERERFTTTL